jgi:nucleoside 2-deoxyribosyltransferase
MRYKVYLAGAIAGLTYGVAQDWRDAVRDALEPDGIECFSPLRAKKFFRKKEVIGQAAYSHPLATDRAIMERDHGDCITSDLIFVNLLGAKEKSAGTIMEMAWAYAYRKRLVLVMEPTKNTHDHPMIRETAGFRAECLSDGIEIVRAVLLSRPAQNPFPLSY